MLKINLHSQYEEMTGFTFGRTPKYFEWVRSGGALDIYVDNEVRKEVEPLSCALLIEPRAIQMSDEFTAKIFTRQAIKDGHRIIFTANRIQYLAPKDKIEMLKTVLPFGLLTKDMALEILDLPPIGGEEGSKILQSLNNIDSNIANDYQSKSKGDE